MADKKEIPQSKPLPKTRNQLITIVVLICIVYLAACGALYLAAQFLDTYQRWFFVAFLFVFPFVAVALFAWLVSRHSAKLYSTSQDGDLTLNTLTPDQQRRKLNAEVSSILLGMAQTNGGDVKATVDNAQRSETRTAYIVAEDLVLRQLELEYGTTFMRHAALEGVPFDGIYMNGSRIAGIEVKFLDIPFLPQEVVDSLLDKAEYAASRLKRTCPDTRFSFILALITQLTPEQQSKLRLGLENKFALTPVNKVELKMFDFDSLQNLFMSDDRRT